MAAYIGFWIVSLTALAASLMDPRATRRQRLEAIITGGVFGVIAVLSVRSVVQSGAPPDVLAYLTPAIGIVAAASFFFLRSLSRRAERER